MEGTYVAVHTFPCTTTAPLSSYQRSRYLANSKMAIAEEMLNHPSVASVDFDGLKLGGAAGTLDLIVHEVEHSLRLVPEVARGNGHIGLTSALMSCARSTLVGMPSLGERSVRELTITYEVTVT